MVYVQRLTFPLFLTLIRLLVSPLVLPILLVYGLPYNSLLGNSCLALLFILFSLTDFFDGYLARRYNQETVLGKLLDPVADKCLLYATLIALVETHKLFFYGAIILIGREFLIMGLRLVALEHDIRLSVAFIGKIKTVIYTLCLTWVILNPYQSLGIKGAFWWNIIEKCLVVFSILVSLVSGWVYYRRFVYLGKIHKLF